MPFPSRPTRSLLVYNVCSHFVHANAYLAKLFFSICSFSKVHSFPIESFAHFSANECRECLGHSRRLPFD